MRLCHLNPTAGPIPIQSEIVLFDKELVQYSHEYVFKAQTPKPSAAGIMYVDSPPVSWTKLMNLATVCGLSTRREGTTLARRHEFKTCNPALSFNFLFHCSGLVRDMMDRCSKNHKEPYNKRLQCFEDLSLPTSTRRDLRDMLLCPHDLVLCCVSKFVRHSHSQQRNDIRWEVQFQ